MPMVGSTSTGIDASKSKKPTTTLVRMHFLHGALGSGQSHILAALTYLLMKEGHNKGC